MLDDISIQKCKPLNQVHTSNGSSLKIYVLIAKE